jgi:hypothetical protein
MLYLVRSKTEGYPQDFYTLVLAPNIDAMKEKFEDGSTIVEEFWMGEEAITSILEEVYGDELMMEQSPWPGDLI